MLFIFALLNIFERNKGKEERAASSVYGSEGSQQITLLLCWAQVETHRLPSVQFTPLELKRLHLCFVLSF